MEGFCEEYVVEETINGERADKVLATHYSNVSRTQIQNFFEQGRVIKNGILLNKKDRLFAGDKVKVQFPEEKDHTIIPVDIHLDILYEDNDLVVVNKKSGQVVHPGNGTGDDTLVHALLHHCHGKLSQAGGETRPGVVHRLDKETSGVIMFAKTDETYLKLIKLFSSREIKKEYVALVVGIPNLKSGSIKLPIGRHPIHRTKMAVNPKGRSAHTDWKLLQTFTNKLGKYALIHCDLHTGRTHQIRVHLSHMGHPIIGDSTYGYKSQLKTDLPLRVMLHAKKISFVHPIKKHPMTIESPLPADLTDIAEVNEGL